MKKLYYILCLFLVFSCMNSSETKSTNIEKSAMEPKAVEVFEATDLKANDLEIFTEQDIAYQKLQEFYDLTILKQLHPEFEEDITKQLEELSSSELNLPRISREIKISNLKQIEASEKLNDSTSKLKLSYDIQSELGTQKDSIFALIKTSTITIEGQQQKAYRITFEKN
ncbi:MAG: hypothetical protein HKO92_10460 [Flavobacteriaceae bacterium]|nr:hypothetical protein [Flavobacteriaceae bacterium]